jgi:hypothetical protein
MSTSGFQAQVLSGRPAAPATAGAPDGYDFSVVLGGPLFQIVRKAHLSGTALELVRRRLVVIAAVAWLPLMILTVLSGRAWGGPVRVPFLMDFEVHVRFLLALPLLILAELVVHERMLPVVRQFVERGLIAPAARARFQAAVESAHRLRNSVPAEVLLLAFVYLIGMLYIWPRYAALNVATWYSMPAPSGGRQLSPAGWWFTCVSVPAFQFILYRWYFRIFVWIRFLWQVSRCELSLVATHPDRSGGLGFLAGTVMAFAPVLTAHGALLSGVIANRIFYEGAKLPDFKTELVIIPSVLLIVVLGPLLMFAPHLATLRRIGLREYGTLAQRYVREFDDKWLRGGAPPGEPLVGSADIQSLADLGNGYQVIKEIRPVPFGKEAVLQLAVLTLLPAAPLALTMLSLDEIFHRLIQVVL